MSEIKNALTAEEWAKAMPLNVVYVMGSIYDGIAEIEGEERHEVAAKCLYGQPFGFTREDVELVRDAGSGSHSSMWATFHNLADRISALLPPEGK